MKQRSNQIDMCTGSLPPKLIRFAIPLMISGMLQLFFNAADIIVVGKFAGDASLAAVTSTGSLASLLVNLFMGLSVGANVTVAHAIGRGDEEKTVRTVHTAILLSFIGGVILAVVGFFASRPMLELMSSPENVIDLSTLYLKIYFIGMPASLAYNFGSALLRAGGDTQRPMKYLFVAGVINVCLNLLFVIVFHLDVAGVGLATVLSQCVSATLVLRCLMKETGPLHLDLKKLCLDKDALVSIVRVGLPAGFQGIVFSISNVVIQSSINSFGDLMVAGSGAAANIEGFVGVGMNSFYQACLTFTGQNYGAGKLDRVDKVVTWCLVIGTGVSLVLCGLAVLFGRQLLGIYTSNPQVVELGMIRIRTVVALLFLNGMLDIMVGGLRGLGCSLVPMVVSVVGICGVRLLWIGTVFQAVHTPQCLFLSYPVSWSVTFICHTCCFLYVRRKVRAKAAALQGAGN